ncbi:MAG: SCO6745 family protein, partial [Pseudonocardia sp.]
TRGYWGLYFPLRAAPLGGASAAVVTALFYGFHPGLVARVLPAAWEVAPPWRFLQARLDAVDAALHRLVGPELLGSPEVAEAAELARAAASGAPTAGRPLGAANADLSWPGPAHLVLWQAQTVLRELRGDGHVAALLTAGLDPVEALALFAADAGVQAEFLRKRRGWSQDEWSAGIGRLATRGLVTSGGAATAAGRALRAGVETRTDILAGEAWSALGDAAADRLVELMAPLVRAVVDGGGFAPANPIGLRPLVGSSGTG